MFFEKADPRIQKLADPFLAEARAELARLESVVRAKKVPNIDRNRVWCATAPEVTAEKLHRGVATSTEVARVVCKEYHWLRAKAVPFECKIALAAIDVGRRAPRADPWRQNPVDWADDDVVADDGDDVLSLSDYGSIG